MIINNSRAEDYEDCNRYYYLKNVIGLALKDEWGAQDRDEGTLFHEIFAAWMDPKAPHDRERVMGIVVNYFNEKLEDVELDIERKAYKERAEYIMAVFDAYVERYKHDTWVVVDVERRGITCLGDECYACGWEYPEELKKGTLIQSLCSDIINGVDGKPCQAPIHYLVGQADAIVLENKLRKLLDHKTKAKTPAASWLASFAESSQFTQYMYIFSRVLGKPVHAAIANVVVKLKKIDKLGDPFKRPAEVTKIDEDYNGFVKDRLSLIQDIERDMTQLELDEESGLLIPKPGTYPFRRNTKNCRKFNRPCEFYGICHPAREDWWAIPYDIADNYKLREKRYVEDYEEMIDEEVR